MRRPQVQNKRPTVGVQPPENAFDGRGLFGNADTTRNDGTQKGRGYLGTIRDSQGRPMTEFSIGVGMDGRDIEIPTMVPTLDPAEIEYLRNMQAGTPMPQSIQQKAIEHAKMRMKQGLSPFHDSGPSHAKPKM
jgi:hypothetical protein